MGQFHILLINIYQNKNYTFIEIKTPPLFLMKLFVINCPRILSVPTSKYDTSKFLSSTPLENGVAERNYRHC